MTPFIYPMHVLLAALATWRITHLLSSEDGPGDLIFHLRKKLGSGLAGALMDCFYCLSLWVSAAMALLVSNGLANWTLAWLGLSGAACLLENATRPPHTMTLETEGESEHAVLRPETTEPESRKDNEFAAIAR